MISSVNLREKFNLECQIMKKTTILLILPLNLFMTAALLSAKEVQCERISNYAIDVHLDTTSNLIRGKEVFAWTNPSDIPVQELWFHLYWNAFKNNKSSLIIRAQRTGMRSIAGWEDEDWGYCKVNSIRIAEDSNFEDFDLLPTLEYQHPDDENIYDQTVFSVMLPKPLQPGETLRMEVAFEARVPRPIYNAGVFKDFYFICQWYPKIGVLIDGKWNCHQHQFGSEYFSEFGTYDVKITLPSSYILGATGELLDKTENNDGMTTHHFFQDCVHDFAWTAFTHFLEFKEVYEFLPGKKVKITLLLQPHHLGIKDRYLKALRATLTFCSRNFMEYPYSTITCVDPPRNCLCSGMEYPTLFTGGAYFLSPKRMTRPENVTIHEFIHGYFYGIVGTNEFEHAWMDEGMTSFYDSEVYFETYEEPLFIKLYFGIPVAFEDVPIPLESEGMIYYLLAPDWDNLQRLSWKYVEIPSYTANPYGKGELLMRTLKRIMGRGKFSQMMRAYVERWKYKHPQPEDFVSTVVEFGGEDLLPFLDQIIYGSATLDYSIAEIKNRRVAKPRGLFDETISEEEPGAQFESEVLVRRLGGLKIPVDIRITFEDGRIEEETWDGQYRWERFHYVSPFRIQSAVVDPDFKLVLDLNRSNNSRCVESHPFPSLKWTTKWLLWLQHALEVFVAFGG